MPVLLKSPECKAADAEGLVSICFCASHLLLVVTCGKQQHHHLGQMTSASPEIWLLERRQIPHLESAGYLEFLIDYSSLMKQFVLMPLLLE